MIAILRAIEMARSQMGYADEISVICGAALESVSITHPDDGCWCVGSERADIAGDQLVVSVHHQLLEFACLSCGFADAQVLIPYSWVSEVKLNDKSVWTKRRE